MPFCPLYQFHQVARLPLVTAPVKFGESCAGWQHNIGHCILESLLVMAGAARRSTQYTGWCCAPHAAFDADFYRTGGIHFGLIVFVVVVAPSRVSPGAGIVQCLGCGWRHVGRPGVFLRKEEPARGGVLGQNGPGGGGVSTSGAQECNVALRQSSRWIPVY